MVVSHGSVTSFMKRILHLAHNHRMTLRVLQQLEESKETEVNGQIHVAKQQDGFQMSFFQLDDPVLCQVRDEILGLDVDNLTPLEALNKLNDIKRIVKG